MVQLRARKFLKVETQFFGVITAKARQNLIFLDEPILLLILLRSSFVLAIIWVDVVAQLILVVVLALRQIFVSLHFVCVRLLALVIVFSIHLLPLVFFFIHSAVAKLLTILTITLLLLHLVSFSTLATGAKLPTILTATLPLLLPVFFSVLEVYIYVQLQLVLFKIAPQPP